MQREEELSDYYNLEDIKCVHYDSEDEYFFLLANKRNEKLGFYLIKFKENDISVFFFLQSELTRLDVSDVNMYVQSGGDEMSGKFKELIVSYKVIFINTYNILLSDISSDIDTEVNIAFRHESH